MLHPSRSWKCVSEDQKQPPPLGSSCCSPWASQPHPTLGEWPQGLELSCPLPAPHRLAVLVRQGKRLGFTGSHPWVHIRATWGALNTGFLSNWAGVEPRHSGVLHQFSRSSNQRASRAQREKSMIPTLWCCALFTEFIFPKNAFFHLSIWHKLIFTHALN